jgi:para-nitrobenzyl esterase
MFKRVSYRIWFAVLIAFFALFGCQDSKRSAKTNDVPVLEPSTTVTIDSGKVTGFVTEQNTPAWLGIRYARAPEGKLRWKPPLSPSGSNTAQKAIVHAPRCPQLSTYMDDLDGVTPGDYVGAEDCLFLDVYAPRNFSDDELLPVMVWVHGGSNVWGGADQYNGSKLAAAGDVIVVVPQYRLGPLGWFAHPTLNGNYGEKVSGNFALLDLQMAFRWVRENISAFGGDPEKVTAFGESAGAFNIFSLLAMDGSQDLIHRAILQSGAYQTSSLHDAIYGERGTVTQLKKVFGEDSQSLERLLSIGSEELLRTFAIDDKVAVVSQIADGITKDTSGVLPSILKNYEGRSLNLIIGANRDEAKLYTAFNHKFAWRLFGKLPIIRDELFYMISSEYINRFWFQAAVIKAADSLRDNNIKTYLYRFDWDELPKYWGVDLKTLLGAAHTMEIPFIFDSFDNHLGRLGHMFFSDENSHGRELLSVKMQSMWSNFAHNSLPSTNGINWRSYQPDMPFILKFDADHELDIAPLNEQYQSLNALLDALKKDSRVNGRKERCLIYDEMVTLSKMVGTGNMLNVSCPFNS